MYKRLITPKWKPKWASTEPFTDGEWIRENLLSVCSIAPVIARSDQGDLFPPEEDRGRNPSASPKSEDFLSREQPLRGLTALVNLK